MQRTRTKGEEEDGKLQSTDIDQPQQLNQKLILVLWPTGV